MRRGLAYALIALPLFALPNLRCWTLPPEQQTGAPSSCCTISR
jgi:hypothetical protein